MIHLFRRKEGVRIELRQKIFPLLTLDRKTSKMGNGKKRISIQTNFIFCPW
jgi:hypothetical protein